MSVRSSYKAINAFCYCLNSKVRLSSAGQSPGFLCEITFHLLSRRGTGLQDLPGPPGSGPAAPLHEGRGNGGAGSGAALPEGRLQKHVWEEAVPARKPAFDLRRDCCHLADNCRNAPLCLQETVAHWIAECRLMIEQTRLLTLHAAHALDTVGGRAARKQVKHSRSKSVKPTASVTFLLLSATFRLP